MKPTLFIKKILGIQGKTKSRDSYVIKDDDVFIISYPKSGNTWVRFLIGNYLTQGGMDFKNSHHVIPDMHFNPADINKITLSPRIIKSHDSFNEKFKNVIYIVRDGRDVAISYFFYLKKAGTIPMEFTFERFFNERFITGKVGFGDWGDHVKSWLKATGANILIVKYEDLMTDTENVFRRILTFLKIDNIDQEQLKSSVIQSSFKNMAKNETDNPKYFFELGGLKDTGYGFMRKGEMGDWQNYFTESDLTLFMDKYGRLMNELGYKGF